MKSENDAVKSVESVDTAGENGTRRRPGGLVAGILFGVFIGAAVALLFAPERGEKTRGQVRRRIHSMRQDALEGIDRAGSVTRKELRRRRRQLQAKLERARERAREIGE